MYSSLSNKQQSVPWKEIVQDLSLHFEHSYIVLDGLDECEEYLQGGIPGITDFIKETMKQTHGQRHLIVAGRNLEQLRNAFEGLKTSTITIDDSVVDLDIQTALRHQLSHEAKFTRWPISLKKKIEESLLAQANGSYVLSLINSTAEWLTPFQISLGGLPVADTATVCDTTGGAKSSERSTKVIGGTLHHGNRQNR